MKSMFLFFLKLTVLFILFPLESDCQWQQDVRLTNDYLESITSLNNAKCIVSDGNIVHAVWASGSSGDWDIFYKRSTDEGLTWGGGVLLTNDPGNDGSVDPCIAVSGSCVCVAWTDLRYRPNWEIYFKRSTDAGLTWSSNLRMTDDNSLSRNPSLAVSDSVVHLVWSEAGSAYYKRSTDKGLNWSYGTVLSDNLVSNGFPSVAVSGLKVHSVWSENNEIYYTHSTDAGISWAACTRLTYDASNSWSPSVSVSGQMIGVTWHDLRDGNYEIYFKQSADGGDTWKEDKRLTYNSYASYNPSVFVSGYVMHVAWYEIYNDYRLFYKKSLDGGISWRSDELLTNTTVGSYNPSLSVSDSVVHALWYDSRYSNTEIFYKRDPTGGSRFTLNLTAIIEGFYNSVSNNMVSDTATVFIRNGTTPYLILDSSKSVLNTSGNGNFYFSRFNNGVNYYITLRHRNSIETWSSSGNTFSSGLLTYNFSTGLDKAFGNNQVLIDNMPERYAIYSGDVNQDGIADASDLSEVENDAAEGLSGYVNTDVTGDDFVDAGDLSILENNSVNGVSAVIP